MSEILKRYFMFSCPVPGCPSKSRGVTGLKWHSLPSRGTIISRLGANGKLILVSKRSAWLDKLKIPDTNELEDKLVCSLHFADDDYTMYKDEKSQKYNIRLKKSAIPSKNLPKSYFLKSNDSEDPKSTVNIQRSGHAKSSGVVVNIGGKQTSWTNATQQANSSIGSGLVLTEEQGENGNIHLKYCTLEEMAICLQIPSVDAAKEEQNIELLNDCGNTPLIRTQNDETVQNLNCLKKRVSKNANKLRPNILKRKKKDDGSFQLEYRSSIGKKYCMEVPMPVKQEPHDIEEHISKDDFEFINIQDASTVTIKEEPIEADEIIKENDEIINEEAMFKMLFEQNKEEGNRKICGKPEGAKKKMVDIGTQTNPYVGFGEMVDFIRQKVLDFTFNAFGNEFILDECALYFQPKVVETDKKLRNAVRIKKDNLYCTNLPLLQSLTMSMNFFHQKCGKTVGDLSGFYKQVNNMYERIDNVEKIGKPVRKISNISKNASKNLITHKPARKVSNISRNVSKGVVANKKIEKNTKLPRNLGKLVKIVELKDGKTRNEVIKNKINLAYDQIVNSKSVLKLDEVKTAGKSLLRGSKVISNYNTRKNYLKNKARKREEDEADFPSNKKTKTTKKSLLLGNSTKKNCKASKGKQKDEISLENKKVYSRVLSKDKINPINCNTSNGNLKVKKSLEKNKKVYKRVVTSCKNKVSLINNSPKNARAKRKVKFSMQKDQHCSDKAYGSSVLGNRKENAIGIKSYDANCELKSEDSFNGDRGKEEAKCDSKNVCDENESSEYSENIGELEKFLQLTILEGNKEEGSSMPFDESFRCEHCEDIFSMYSSYLDHYRKCSHRAKKQPSISPKKIDIRDKPVAKQIDKVVGAPDKTVISPTETSDSLGEEGKQDLTVEDNSEFPSEAKILDKKNTVLTHREVYISKKKILIFPTQMSIVGTGKFGAVDRKRKMDDTVPIGTDQKRKMDDTVPSDADQKRTMDDTVPSGTDQKRKMDDIVPSGTDQKRKMDDTVPIGTDQKRKMDDTLPSDADQKRTMDDTVPSGTDQKRKLDDIVPSGTDQKRKMDDAVPCGTDQERKMDDKVPSGTDEKRKMDDIVPSGTDQKRKMDYTVPSGTDQKRKLDDTVPSGTDQKLKMDDTVPSGTDQKRKMDDIVPNGTDDKRKMDDTVPSGTDQKLAQLANVSDESSKNKSEIEGASNDLRCCRKCKRILRKDEMKCHAEKCLPSFPSMKCEICNVWLSSINGNVMDHLAMHDEQCYFCTRCGVIFLRSNVKTHKCTLHEETQLPSEDLHFIHTDRKPHCKLCLKSFENIEMFGKHIYSSHRSRSKKIEMDLRITNKILKKYRRINLNSYKHKCVYCRKLFVSLLEETNHYETCSKRIEGINYFVEVGKKI